MPVLPARLAAGEFDAVWVLEPFITQIDFTRFDTLTALTTKYIASPFPAYAIGFSPQFLKNTTKIQRTRLKIALDAAVDRIDAQPGEAKKIVSHSSSVTTPPALAPGFPCSRKSPKSTNPASRPLPAGCSKLVS